MAAVRRGGPLGPDGAQSRLGGRRPAAARQAPARAIRAAIAATPGRPPCPRLHGDDDVPHFPAPPAHPCGRDGHRHGLRPAAGGADGGQAGGSCRQAARRRRGRRRGRRGEEAPRAEVPRRHGEQRRQERLFRALRGAVRRPARLHRRQGRARVRRLDLRHDDQAEPDRGPPAQAQPRRVRQPAARARDQEGQGQRHAQARGLLRRRLPVLRAARERAEGDRRRHDLHLPLPDRPAAPGRRAEVEA